MTERVQQNKISEMFIFLCLFSFPLLANIGIVTNGIADPNHIAKILGKEVVECDLTPLQKKKKPKIDPTVEKILFMNIPKKGDLSLLPKEKLVLFMWEPPLRLSKMYKPKVQKCFSKIYTFNDDLVDNKTYFKLYYPERKPMPENLPSFKEKKLITTIIGATSDKSRHHPNELYSKRIEAIRFFEKKNIGFEFFGRNWKKKEFPSYGGEVENKLTVLKNYKFTLCYENCQGLPGYITEKIFDCFAAGSIPIYWGASNVEKYIPRKCFIDRREFKTLDELYNFIKNMPEKTYNEYLSHIRTFLKSEQSECFSPEHYTKTIRQSLTS